MNLGRIFGVILSIIIALSIIDNGVNNIEANSFELIGNNGYISDNSISLNSRSLTNENNISSEVIHYTNNQPYSISINTSNIDINCNSSIKEDEELVKNNIKVKALFSYEKDGEKLQNITIKSKESIYIHVINEYFGNTYPTSEVTCEYRIDIKDF